MAFLLVGPGPVADSTKVVGSDLEACFVAADSVAVVVVVVGAAGFGEEHSS